MTEDEVEGLRREVLRLRALLRLTDVEAAQPQGVQSAWFDQAPGSIDVRSSPRDKVDFYAAMFRARTDVYAVRWANSTTGKSGWMPAVEGGWRRDRGGGRRNYLPLTTEVLAAHLTGEVHVGLYPMLPRDLTSWLAADFDGQAAMLDALAYLKAARAVGAPAALEVSRSGVGAHVWLFFTEPVAAAIARQLGTSLVREAIALRGRMDLRCYDRLFPSQDMLPGQGPGNLIAAPLHGRSRRLGTTVFLDLATLEPYEDQWAYLSTLQRLTPKQVARLASELRAPSLGADVTGARPATSTRTQPNPAARVHLRLEGGVDVAGEELSPSLYASLTHAASTLNPEFYDRQRRRQSTWKTPRIITSFDETIDDHLVLPRGLLDLTIRLITEAGSQVVIDDRRFAGDTVDLTSAIVLSRSQREAVEALTPHDLGVLVAPPGAGKTVMACAVIAQRATSTLVLVDRKALADQWRRQVSELLGFKPGQIGGGRAKLTGRIDVATLQTLARRTDLSEALAAYGLIVVDECHHVPAAAFESVVRSIPARFWLGLTATPYRRDKLDDLIGFQLGPIRCTLESPEAGTLEGAAADRPSPVLVVHHTRLRIESDVDLSRPGAIAEVHRALAEDPARNEQILADVNEAHERGRHCLVLAQRTAHVDDLAARLSARGLEPVVLKGGMGARSRRAALERLVPSSGEAPLLVVATGPLVGEGFDCPALDTLFLAGPVSFRGRLVQYVGRILRAHPGKRTAEVHDYHDVETPVLAAALSKRAPGYVSLGFPDPRKVSPSVSAVAVSDDQATHDDGSTASRRLGRVAEDYCELCDLPLSQCVHGMPKPEPQAVTAPPARATRVTTSRPAGSSASSPRTSPARTPATPAAPARRAPSLVTGQDAFREHIVRILRQEGPLETEDMLLELEMAMEDVLRDRDRQKAPTGEVRWHATARAERKAMIDARLMVEGKPGVWELTEAGRSVAY